MSRRLADNFLCLRLIYTVPEAALGCLLTCSGSHRVSIALGNTRRDRQSPGALHESLGTDRGTVQSTARSPAGGQRLPGATNVGMAQIPAGVGGQGHGLERQANAADFIAVLVNGRHQAGIGFSRFRRDMRGDAGLRPEGQTLEASRGVGKVDPGDSLEGGSKTLRRS